MERKTLNLTPDEINEAVKNKYGQVASNPCGDFNFPVGRKFALSVGYAEEALASLPEAMYESFTGAGNPQPFVAPPRGAALLDLGCGAGLDLFFYAQKVDETGRVYGLDFSGEMAAKAERNLKAAGAKNFRIFCAPANAIPLEDKSADIVTSNGIYNLSPDKNAVVREAFRVLKPGGKTVFSEIVLKGALPERILESINDWFRCIGGAMVEGDLIAMFEAAGFESVEILDKTRNARCGHELAVCATVSAAKPGSV